MTTAALNPNCPTARLGRNSQWTEEEENLRARLMKQLWVLDEESALQLLSEHWPLITGRRGAKSPPKWDGLKAYWASLHPDALKPKTMQG